MSALVLSLFPGIGLLDMAFEEAGFCVVRGPDTLWGGDVKRFHPPSGRFDGVIGGPPCQAFSRLRHIVEANGYKTAENLIPEFERVVTEAAPDWFVMENVPDAPEPVADHFVVSSVTLNNRWFGGEQRRVRGFSFGIQAHLGVVDPWRYLQTVALESFANEPAVCASDGGRYQYVRIGGSGKPKQAIGAATIPLRSVRRMLELQGFAADLLDHAPFTDSGKRRVVGNGVPLAMGRAAASVILGAVYGHILEAIA